MNNLIIKKGDIEKAALTNVVLYHVLQLNRQHLLTWEETMEKAVIELIKQNEKLFGILLKLRNQGITNKEEK